MKKEKKKEEKKEREKKKWSEQMTLSSALKRFSFS